MQIYKKIQNKNNQQKIDEFTFNCFQMKEITKGNEIQFLLIHLFNRFQLLKDLNIDLSTFYRFTKEIQKGYRDVPYHNKLHAFDVLQTLNFFMIKCQFSSIANLSKLEQAAMYISAAAHDYDHPGFSNIYLKNTKNQLAIRYNDISILENHHVSSLFIICFKDEKQNILKNFSNQDYIQFRHICISMILATDMTNHFKNIAKLQQILSEEGFSINEENKLFFAEALLHASDISNPMKHWDVSSQWAVLASNEFCNQGDLERAEGLEISYLCDRYSVNLAKSQINFCDYIVKPLFEKCVEFLPLLQEYIQNFEQNKKSWNQLIDYYDLKLSFLFFVIKKIYIFFNSKNNYKNKKVKMKNNNNNNKNEKNFLKIDFLYQFFFLQNQYKKIFIFLSIFMFTFQQKNQNIINILLISYIYLYIILNIFNTKPQIQNFLFFYLSILFIYIIFNLLNNSILFYFFSFIILYYLKIIFNQKLYQQIKYYNQNYIFLINFYKKLYILTTSQKLQIIMLYFQFLTFQNCQLLKQFQVIYIILIIKNKNNQNYLNFLYIQKLLLY
ncbi:hypothetical protein IMG5_137410 [Ichthyophthirius multifiliis]|uniref:Phosphodiesterase n=1 Tax=Ichthyophthirius multifiliis TaxID=5932 RepID=G0QX25_ICHMU|nr:hypothetical protein IMG5_137410 [Ichthyophthirius multifiliis]EGR30229.1 hypothetical protein IMG5_137410 [Ichthyophthirius multifiliis]|eukprot:XP_004031825.1 hypothetical protein IMG5_137410 [Ichthyophthirius multifiliis]